MRSECILCHSGIVEFNSKLQHTPYVVCGNCKVAYQPNPPEKVYESSAEVSGDMMTFNDKVANLTLANALHHNWLLTPGKHLDLGSKFPYLSSCLRSYGHEAYGLDGIPEVIKFGKQLGVPVFHHDWERDEDLGIEFDSITLIHCQEHFYNPIQAFKKIARHLKPGGILFIRCPDYQVNGIERDLTEPHYQIHPLIYCKEATEYLINAAGDLQILQTYPITPGQRDYIVRRI